MEDIRIQVRKGVSPSAVLVDRNDGRYGCTLMRPLDEDIALRFVQNSLRIELNETERQMICERLNSAS